MSTRLQMFAPAIDEAIHRCARGFRGSGTEGWDQMFNVEDRLQDAYLACLLSFDHIMAARNPAGLAFTISKRSLTKRYRRDYHKLVRGRTKLQSDNSEGDTFGQRLREHTPTFEVDPWYESNRAASERTEYELAWEILGPKILRAKQTLDEEQSFVIEAMYGHDDWKMAEIQRFLGIGRRKVMEIHGEAINKIRYHLGWPPLERKIKAKRSKPLKLARATHRFR